MRTESGMTPSMNDPMVKKSELVDGSGDSERGEEVGGADEKLGPDFDQNPVGGEGQEVILSLPAFSFSDEEMSLVIAVIGDLKDKLDIANVEED